MVIAAAAEGDVVARGLLARAGAMLGATAVHVIRTLRMEHTAFDLVLARHLFDGGAMTSSRPWKSCVRPIAPDARLKRLAVPRR